MTRIAELRKVLDEEFAKPYISGESDCFFLTLRVVDALAGTSMVEQHQGKYTSIVDGNKALRKSGYKKLSNVLAEHLPEITPSMATMGDVVVVQVRRSQHLGVCLGPRFMVKTMEGRRTYELADVVAAFRTERV